MKSRHEFNRLCGEKVKSLERRSSLGWTARLWRALIEKKKEENKERIFIKSAASRVNRCVGTAAFSENREKITIK